MSDAEELDQGADDLLRRALIDAESSAAVALSVGGLPVSDEVTVIFHGRRDLGTIQTYVAPGRHGAGESVGAAELLRAPSTPNRPRPGTPTEPDGRSPDQPRA